MPLEQYVAAVLAGECSTFRSDEAIKAMAVAARSYGLHLRGRHAAEGYDLCSTTHCQRVEPDAVTPRLASLAAQTAGEMLWFAGKPAFACYSRNCGGTPKTPAQCGAGCARPSCAATPTRIARGRAPADGIGPCPPHRDRGRPARSQLRTPAEIAHRHRCSARPRAAPACCGLLGDGERVRVAASSFRFAMGRALGFKTVRSDLWGVARSGGRLTFNGTGEGHGVGHVPARRRPDGRRRPRLSRDSGLLLSRHAPVG